MKKSSIRMIISTSLMLGVSVGVLIVKKGNVPIIASSSEVVADKIKEEVIIDKDDAHYNSESKLPVLSKKEIEEEVEELYSNKEEIGDFELGLALTDDVDELLETVLTLSLDSTTHEALAKLYRLSINDPSVAEFISKEFLNEINEVEDGDDLDSLYGMLTFLPSIEVTNHAFKLLSSESINDRRRAYSLLTQSQDADPSLVLKKVWDESDATLAGYAVSAIGERNDIIQRVYPPEVKARLASELSVVYASHESPEVRAAALTQISLLGDQNDDSRRLVESALDNSDSIIRTEAIMAIARNKYYSDTNKLKLLSIAVDRDTDKNTRLVAHDALAFYDFELQESERHRLIELKKELDQLDSII